MARHADLELPDGRQRVVRHGHDPVRPIQTGIGPIEVSKPKARDRGATTADERIRYSSAILLKWARRTKSLDVHLPALYLRGVSTGDFQDVLTALLGKDAPNLSPSVIGRFGRGAVLGKPDFAQIPMRVGLNRLRQLVEDVQVLVLPTPLMTRRGERFIQSLPEAKRAVADGDIRRNRQTARLQIDKQFLPALTAFPQPVCKPRSSFLPSGVAPISTSMHSACGSMRACR